MDETTTPLSAYDRWLARREEHRRLCAAGGEDRLTALPDDVLRLVLRRLDTRSALATAALSSHWACLARNLPVLQFKVGDILPERYRRYLRRRLHAVDAVAIRKINALIGRYERHGMRSLTSAVTNFLDAETSDDDGYCEARRSADAMDLELFPTHNAAPFTRLIAKAVGYWGVEDLEVHVLNPTPCHGAKYSFPHHCFDFEGSSESPGCDGLKKLKLTNCIPLAARDSVPAPRAFTSLVVLVLQSMPRSTRGRIYERVVRACPMLETLHLKSCLFQGTVSIDAPGSRVMELVMEGCTFKAVRLCALPLLERLAYVGAPTQFVFGSLPRLARLNLGFQDDPNARYGPFFPGVPDLYSILDFTDSSSCFLGLESLVVRYTGPEIWIVPDVI